MNSPKSDGFQLAAFFAWLGELVLYLCKGMRVGAAVDLSQHLAPL